MKKYSLIGVDGNAFSVMAYVSSAMKKEGHGKEQIDDYFKSVTSGDYDNLIVKSLDVINLLNKGKKNKAHSA